MKHFSKHVFVGLEVSERVYIRFDNLAYNNILGPMSILADCLSGLVARVRGCRSRGPGFVPGRC
jgi:hypothetical protein